MAREEAVVRRLAEMPMVIRYYAIATVIVTSVVAALLALGPLVRPPSPTARPLVTTAQTPSPPGPNGRDSAATSAPFRGDAPWALSALPDCYRQLSLIRDRRAVVDESALPSVLALPPGSTLTTGSCVVSVEAGRLRIHRDDDVLDVPDVRRFYVGRGADGKDEAVVVRAGDALTEMRRYALEAPSVADVAGTRTTLHAR